MTPDVVWLFIFAALYWGVCLYWAATARPGPGEADTHPLFGRTLPGWAFVFSATVIVFSGWAYVGHPGLISAQGLPYAGVGLAAIALPLMGVMVFQRQWLLGRAFGYRTPGALFGGYYASTPVRWLVAIVALGVTVPFLALQLRAAGIVFAVLTDGLFPLAAGAGLLAAAIFACLALGRLRASARIDTLGGVLLLLGIGLTAAVALHFAGGWSGLADKLGELARSGADGARMLQVPGVTGIGTPQTPAGAWPEMAALTFVVALMGLQTSPALSQWTLASRSSKPFAAQQVWVSGLLTGLVLVVFATATGLGAHFAGPELAQELKSLHVDGVAALPGRQDAAVPLVIGLMGPTVPWLIGLLGVAALAAMQSAGASFAGTAANIAANETGRADSRLIEPVVAAVIVAAALALALTTTAPLMQFAGLAGAVGLQMLPALIGLGYAAWLTAPGVAAGLIAGLVAMALHGPLGQPGLGLVAETGWPLGIHAGVWALAINAGVCLLVSAFTRNAKARAHRDTHHAALRNALGPPAPAWKTGLAWLATAAWLGFAIGPGAMPGNAGPGDPADPATWVSGLPPLWAWQIAWWALGVVLLWWLAYGAGLSKEAPRASEAFTKH